MSEKPYCATCHAPLDARDEINRLRTALIEIDTMPVSMVNDSESLRHSIRAMQTLARLALSSDNGERS